MKYHIVSLGWHLPPGLIDAVDLGLAPGDYRLFRPQEVESRKELDGFSTHEGDILKVLALAETLGQTIPPLIILGIQPARLEAGLELSSALQQGFETYVRVAIEEVLRKE